jgi:cell division protein ZapE
MNSVIDTYVSALSRGYLTPDTSQENAARALDLLRVELGLVRSPVLQKIRAFFRSSPPKSSGVYLHGGVGRGKSMLMDMFYQRVKDSVPARRVHFHEFMIETHDWLHANRRGDTDDLLIGYAAHVSSNAHLICFDEFHVTDVADAMILSRLFTSLFDKGVAVVATSNWPPDKLYEGGLQRELFLPFIDLIKLRMNVVHLDNGIDYRMREQAPRMDSNTSYFYPLNAATKSRITELFETSSAGQEKQTRIFTVKGRDIAVPCAGHIARLSFADMCERPHAAEDYLKIADAFDVFFLEGVPKMGYDRRNETKRLMLLIDVLYDKNKKLIVSADAPPEKLYHGHDHAFEFGRTISRLSEMTRG